MGNRPEEQLVERGAVVHLLQQLVRIPSINPLGDPECTGPMYTEEKMALAVAEYFKGTRCHVSLSYVLPDRPNVVITLPGQNPESVLLFETHMDTVKPSSDQRDPFDPVVRDGAVWGRGSCDAKASLASMMVALKGVAAAGEPPPSTIMLAAVIDEEYGFTGVKHLVEEGLSAAAAVVGEPTLLRIVTAHKGVLRFKVEVLGRTAHSSVADRGVNAILMMNRVLTMIERELKPSLLQITHPQLGSPTINVGTIRGGLQANVVPDRCIIDIDRRLLPGEEPEAIVADFARRLAAIREREPLFDYTLHPPYLIDNSLDTPPDAPIVACARSVCAEMGLSDELQAVPYGTDGSKLADAGIPTIVLGPGSIDVAHTAVEHVEVTQLERAVQLYAGLMLQFASS